MSNSLAFDEVPRTKGGIGATEQIARILNDAGIDAPASLYDEALAYARNDKLAAATERLRMLLCLDPDDAEAALLLAKVLASRSKWQEALSYLDTAIANGAVPPPGLREHVEANLRQQVQEDEAQRARLAAREQTEIQNLRREAKRLRSDNAALDAQVDDLQKRVRIWSSVTALVAGSASALLLASFLFNGAGSTAEVAAAEGAAATAAAAGAPAAVEQGLAAEGAPAAAAPAIPERVENPPTINVPPVPVAPAPAAAAEAPAAAAPAAAPEAAPRPAVTFPVKHTVASGDTLGGLAQRYYGKSSLHTHIKKANNLQSIELKVGQKLTIPAPPK